MSQPSDQSASANPTSNPIFDSMPEIPTFEPAPVPKPVVTDTMPPIPVTAPVATPAPVKAADMPVMAQKPQPVAPKPTTSGMPQSLNTPNPATSAAPVSPSSPTAPVMPAKPAAPAMSVRLATPATPAAPTAPVIPAAPTTSVQTTPNRPAPFGQLPPTQPTQPAQPTQPNQLTQQTQPNQPTQPAQPAAGQSSVASSMQQLLDEPTNPFAEAAAKNNEVRNVSFSTPNATIATNNSAAKDKKKLLLVGGGVVLVVVLAIIVIAMSFGGNNQPTPSGSSSNTPTTPTTKAGTYVCSRDYLDSEIHSYGDTVQAVSQTIEVEFSEKGFKNIESKTTITYEDSTVVKDGYAAQKEQHITNYQALGFTSDPLISSYKRDGAKLIVTRAADVASLNSKGLSLFDLTTSKTPSTLSTDDVLDLIEENKFSCKEKTAATETDTTETTTDSTETTTESAE